MHYLAHYQSPLGNMTLASDGKSLTGLWMEGQKYFESTISGEVIENESLPLLAEAKAWLDSYFDGQKPDISRLPLAPAGSDFRKAVWNILCEIPYGQTMTYGEIAKSMAQRTGKKQMSAQAIGGAVAHNPISVIIPCHRVVGANGSLTGYAGGIAKKMQLLEMERVDLAAFFVPQKGTAL